LHFLTALFLPIFAHFSIFLLQCGLILDLDSNFRVTGKHKFDRPVNFICGSICSSDAGIDFRFIDENNFEYIRNMNIDYRPGEKGYIFVKIM